MGSTPELNYPRTKPSIITGISFYLLNKQEETFWQLQIIEFQNKTTLYRAAKLTYQKRCFIG